jgi:hypothetical protein
MPISTKEPQRLNDLMVYIKLLSREEQLQLATYLLEQLQYTPPISAMEDWQILRGLVPAPALGQDAQTWVSHTRQQADNQREIQWINPA